METTSCLNNHDFCNGDAAAVPELTCSITSSVLVYKFKEHLYSMYMMPYYLFKICPI